MLLCCGLLGVEVNTWAGKAVLRRPPGAAKPPPPVRRSSSVTASMNGAMDRPQSQRGSKPPVLSPKPKLTSPGSDGRTSTRTSTTSASSDGSSFPAPPPLTHQDDEGIVLHTLICWNVRQLFVVVNDLV